MDDKKTVTKTDRQIELRSEKVRNIIGEIPPVLLRNGIGIIVMVLVVLVVISSFLPYKETVGGTVTIYSLPSEQCDTLRVAVLLKLPEGKTMINPTNCKIHLSSPMFTTTGRVVTYNPLRTTEGKNRAEILLPHSGLEQVEQSEVDFRILLSESTIFHRFIKSLVFF